MVIGQNSDLAVLGSRFAITDLGLDAGLLHDAGYPIAATGFTGLPQIIMDLAITVDAATFQPGLLDVSRKSLALLLPRELGLFAPGIVAAAMDTHHAAKGAQGKLLLMRPDEGVPYRDSLAKCAVLPF